MRISFTDTSYCSIEFETEIGSERQLLRDIYMKLISKTPKEQKMLLAKILEDLE